MVVELAAVKWRTGELENWLTNLSDKPAVAVKCRCKDCSEIESKVFFNFLLTPTRIFFILC